MGSEMCIRDRPSTQATSASAATRSSPVRRTDISARLVAVSSANFRTSTANRSSVASRTRTIVPCSSPGGTGTVNFIIVGRFSPALAPESFNLLKRLREMAVAKKYPANSGLSSRSSSAGVFFECRGMLRGLPQRHARGVRRRPAAAVRGAGVRVLNAVKAGDGPERAAGPPAGEEACSGP